MSIINLKERTINAKIVYYGTALGGKTTSLKQVHRVIDPEQNVELVSLNTEQDRTLFFDFLPITLGRIGGFTVRMQGFTVPGQVKYNLTRKYVLTGADAVVLVVDSQRSQLENNAFALENLKENLLANGLDYATIPLVLQYNKRDLSDAANREELDALLNDRGIPVFESVATEGPGVFEAFVEISRRMVDHIATLYRLRGGDSIGAALGENLNRLLDRSRDGGGLIIDPVPIPMSPAGPAAVAEVGRVAGQVTIGGLTRAPRTDSEDLLRRAVDSNIEIAKLYSEVNEVKNRLQSRVDELTTLNEVGRTLTSVLDVDELLQTVLDSATRCLGTDCGSVLTASADGATFAEKVVSGFLWDPLTQAGGGSFGSKRLSERLAQGEGLVISDEVEPEIISSVRELDDRIRTLLVAPLLHGNGLLGLIVIYILDGDPGGAREKLNFLSTLASHASVALDNARLVGRIEGFNRELELKVRERTDELRKAYDELKELDGMKDAFLSSMSHELLTPLTSIRSFSEILLGCEEPEREATLPEFLDIIHRESIRLTERLRDLLDLSQIESGDVEFRIEPMDLAAVARDVVESLMSRAEAAGISLGIACPPGGATTAGDARWISRALKNLLENALKFSDEGGRVSLSLEVGADRTIVEIRDQGPGIAPEYQSIIFERFKQIGEILTDKPSGIGLGLPLAKEIVTRHGGRIWVESAPGKGARFCLSLPRQPLAAPATRR